MTIPQSKYKLLFYLLAIVILITMVWMSFDFGITWDEWVHAHYGKLTWRYFLTGGQDRGVLGSELEGYRLQYYGNFFDVVATFVYGIVSGSLHSAVFDDLNWNGFYETKHAVNALFGFFAMLLIGFSAKELAGWRVGVIALLFSFLTPRFLGHSMNNAKDIPFAMAYIFAIFGMIKFFKEFPKPKIKTSIMLVIAIAISITTRIGGILLIFYFVLFNLIYWFDAKRKNISISLRQLFLCVILICICGYFGGLILWPFGHTAPFKNPYLAFKEMSNYVLVIPVLFEGKLIASNQIPWYYIPKWILISTPFFVLLGWCFSMGAFLKRMVDFKLLGLILMSIFFPLAFVILKHSTLYDEWRHLLFIYPSLVIIAALGWEFLIQFFENSWKRILVFGSMLILMGEPAVWMIRNHPHEYIYFNQIVGGLRGAFGNYDLDYWGNSIRFAAEWLRDSLKRENFKKPFVVSADGSIIQHAYYLKDAFPDQYQPLSLKVHGMNGWDYGFVLTRNWKKKELLSKAWPPEGTVHEIKADGVTICAVVKNLKSNRI